MPKTPSPKVVELIKHFEGFRAEAYLCPAGKWTIGYGHTLTARKGMRISQAEGEALLKQDLLHTAMLVTKEIREAKQCQFDALVSFTFNVGIGRFRQSTLLKLFNAGKIQGVLDEFPKWRKSAGKVERGLIRRRAAERALFEGKQWRDYAV